MNAIGLRGIMMAAALVWAMLLCGGCSSFDHDWDAAAGQRPHDDADITGRWQGTWSSDADGHSGDLRCLITQLDEHTYHARFAATYASVLHFNYDVDLDAQRKFDWITFEGSANLGALAGGEYHYDGHANSDTFVANYQSSADHGQFNLKRP